jgi:hypothetical protein
MSTGITYSQLPDVLAAQRPEDDARIMALAQAQFGVAYYKARGDLVRALAVVATRRPELRADIVAMLRAGLHAALWRGDKRDGGEPGQGANFIGVSAAAVALARLDAREAVPELGEALTAVAVDAVHYELRQCAGPLAVSLAVLGSTDSAAPQRILADYHRIWGTRHAFVHQLRYAVWVMQRDQAGARAWIDQAQDGRLYAAAALADLDAPSPAAIFGLDLWHSNEPAGEFPEIYRVSFAG